MQGTEVKRPYLRLHQVSASSGAGQLLRGRGPTDAFPGGDDLHPALLPSTTFGTMLAAASMHRLSAAQTKSIGVVNTTAIIRSLIPDVCRSIFPFRIIVSTTQSLCS